MADSKENYQLDLGSERVKHSIVEGGAWEMKWFCEKHPYPIKRKYSLFYHKLQFVSVQFITIFFHKNV